MSKRNNKFTKTQINGIDITIKAASKKYPFIKGWRFDKDFEKYESLLYIDVIIDYNEMAEIYNDKIHPMYKDVSTPLNSSLFMFYLSKNPSFSEDQEGKDEYFDLMYGESMKVKNYVKFIYENLPDEYAIYYPLSGSHFRCTLMIDNFISIS